MNIVLITAIVWLCAQLGKLATRRDSGKKFRWVNLFDYGGMPSSHAASIASLSTSIGLSEGWGSPLFAICVIIAVFIVHDALRLRNIIQIQSKLLNHVRAGLSPAVQSSYPVISEKVGHTVSEVLVGLLLGILLTLLLTRIL